MYPVRQTFLVLGLSRSGCAAAEFLLERKAKVFVYDDVAGEAVENPRVCWRKRALNGRRKNRFPVCTKSATRWF